MKTYKNKKKNNSKTKKVFGGEHYKSGDGMFQILSTKTKSLRES